MYAIGWYCARLWPASMPPTPPTSKPEAVEAFHPDGR